MISEIKKEETERKKEAYSELTDGYQLSNEHQIEELPYTTVGKLSENLTQPTQLPYTHVSKLVSILSDKENFFNVADSLLEVLNALHPAITKQLLYLTLHTSRIYSGLAKKTLKISDLQFERQIIKLVKVGILKPVKNPNSLADPFLRWTKQMNPNLPMKRLCLYKISEPYRLLFSKLESDLEQTIGKEIIDEIRHYRFSIRRTHRDIERETKLKKSQQKKLIEEAKKDKYSRFIGKCTGCSSEIYEQIPSLSNPQVVSSYRNIGDRPYCMECFRAKKV